ncbi:MAG: hypothetical protein IJK26_00440 [Clostridia bacterium]|nr:hypothetical protein [Clostridia bacterium]
MSIVNSLNFTQLLIIELIGLGVVVYYIIKDFRSKKAYVPILYLIPLLSLSSLIYKYAIDHPNLDVLNRFANVFLPLSLVIFFVGLFVISIINIKKNNQEIDKSSIIKLIIMLAAFIVLFVVLRFVIPNL